MGRVDSKTADYLELSTSPPTSGSGGDTSLAGSSIQFLLGRVSIQTTEPDLGCNQKLRFAVDDKPKLNRSTRADYSSRGGHAGCMARMVKIEMRHSWFFTSSPRSLRRYH